VPDNEQSPAKEIVSAWAMTNTIPHYQSEYLKANEREVLKKTLNEKGFKAHE
jgi:hypothetical protein